MVIAFGSLILMLAAAGGAIFVFIRLLRDGLSRESQRVKAEEAKIIQDIYQGLLKMEERIEALETILLDREKDRKRKESRE